MELHSTKQRLLEVGLPLLLEHGYNGLGVQAVLEAAGIPKGSFYHHFQDKQDFALQVIDQYMTGVHDALDPAVALGPYDDAPVTQRHTVANEKGSVVRGVAQ